jgi:hypothetical protein
MAVTMDKQTLTRAHTLRAGLTRTAAFTAATVISLSGPLLPAVALAERPATLRTFVGQWYGHTRSLTVDSKGVAHEFLSAGCCDPLVRLRLRLYAPRGTATDASVKAYVSWVEILDPRAFDHAFPPPRTGEIVTWRLDDGVVAEPATHINYCDHSASGKGMCGA